jgi:hypothetical protein
MDGGHFISLDTSITGAVTMRTKLCPLRTRRAYSAPRNGWIEMDEMKMVLSTLLNSSHCG